MMVHIITRIFLKYNIDLLGSIIIGLRIFLGIDLCGFIFWFNVNRVLSFVIGVEFNSIKVKLIYLFVKL